jgi:RNA polymerase sigma factor (sigma-70 family)
MDDGTGGLIRDIQTLFDVGVQGVHTDGQLLGRFVDHGDGEALGALVHRHGSMVWGVCRRILHDDHDAEDAFQATFLVLVRRAAAVAPREKVGLWLHGVARQTALKARAVKARRRGRERPVPVVPAAGGKREERTDERLLELDRELSRLPEKYRAPIVLCELEGRSHREAAEQLRWPIGTLSGRLSRGRALLARRLSRRGPMPVIGPLGLMFARDVASACVPSSVLSSTIRAVTLGAASPAAGLISPRVAALSEGVIKIMMLTKLRSVVIPAALALGFCGIAGAVVGLARDDKGPGAAAPARAIAQTKGAAGQVKAPRSIDGTPALLQARPGLAQKGYEASFEELQQTTRLGNVLVVVGKPDQVYRWSIRWLQAERDLNPKGPGHLAALEAHLKRMIELEKRVEMLNRALLPNTQKLEAEWYVLEARLWLEQAKVE